MANFFDNNPLRKMLGEGLEALAQQKVHQLAKRSIMPQMQQQEPQEQPSQIKQPTTFAESLNAILNPEQNIAEFRIPEGLKPAEAKQLADIAQKRQKSDFDKELAERKNTLNYLSPYEASHERNQDIIRSNKQLKDIAASGNLRAGNLQETLDRAGLGDYLRPIENELAQKNIKQQTQNAAAAFNTKRLTNFEVGSYEKSLGTLWNTPEGLYAIASINNLITKTKDAKHLARRAIIKENKGKTPSDIEEQAEVKAQPQVKKFADKASKVVNNAVDKYNKAVEKGKKDGFKNLQDALKTLKSGQTVTDRQTGKTYDFQGKEVKKG